MSAMGGGRRRRASRRLWRRRRGLVAGEGHRAAKCRDAQFAVGDDDMRQPRTEQTGERGSGGIQDAMVSQATIGRFCDSGDRDATCSGMFVRSEQRAAVSTRDNMVAVYRQPTIESRWNPESAGGSADLGQGPPGIHRYPSRDGGARAGGAGWLRSAARECQTESQEQRRRYPAADPVVGTHDDSTRRSATRFRQSRPGSVR